MMKSADTPTAHAPIDATLSATFAKLTRGISPISVTGAYLDWVTHLAASPGKWRTLYESASRDWSQWLSYVQASVEGPCVSCASGDARDKRFRAPEWNKLPFNWISQAFLIQEQWWSEATTGLRGVSRHHEEVVEFSTRQWLDMWAPSNFVATNPEVLAQTVNSGGMNLVRGATNWWRDVSDFYAQRKPPGAEAFVPGQTVAVTPGKVIYRNRLIELIQYEPTTRNVKPEPILIVPSWIMKYYILDLSPHNSLVKYLVDAGHTVFVMSWKNPTAEDRELSLEDYLTFGVMMALEQIKLICPDRKIHAAGYCLGGTLLAIAAAAIARDARAARARENGNGRGTERRAGKRSPTRTVTSAANDGPFASLSFFASQVDFHEPGELSLFIDDSQIAYLEDIMWEQGYLDGKQMAGAFALMNSNDLIWSRHIHNYLMGTRSQMNDLKAWNADATRLPYRMHSQYLRSLYLKNDLAEGRFQVNDKAINLRDIQTPMFVVSTEFDHVSPWRSVYKIHLLTDCEISYVLCSGGHNVGVVNPPLPKEATMNYRVSYRFAVRERGSPYVDPDTWLASTDTREGSWWPAWVQWLDRHSGKAIAAIPIGGRSAAHRTPLANAPGTYVHMS